MDGSSHTKPPTIAIAVSIFAVAVITGLPSLRGEFLSGDDYHLVRDHVLVNHPSMAHAIELFTIVHRDLYQPIPLLSFSMDFAVINWLGLLPTADGPNAGAWVFHLTNILIHACNAVLVLFVVSRLTTRTAVAAVAATIFAIHPLAVETIAWLNGRMIMLSTCFTLAAVICFDRWDHRPRARTAVALLAFTILAHISKISMSLPILIAICTLARRRRPDARWWAGWLGVSLITAAFAAFNIYSSAAGEMFRKAAGEMPGSPILYTLQALSQYFRHFVIPVGLSHWYPPPDDIGWSQPYVISAAVTVALVITIALVLAPRTRVGVLGLAWFLVAVGPTLPIVPARRALAADRYVYLANIGLQWIAAAVLVGAFIHLSKRVTTANRRALSKSMLACAGVAAAVALVTVSWHNQAYYRDNIALAERIIQCYPDEPSVYESAAWAYYRKGRYRDAVRIALKDLERHPKEMACEVYQVVGMSYLRLGQHDEALASLRRAIQADPDYGKCYSRLAQIQVHLGQHDDAIANYRRAIEIMPFYNPAVTSLASVYRTVGRTEEAEQAYYQALENNPYDVHAHLALAEINIERGHFPTAISRLRKLLDWMPENTVARTNLGVAYERLDHLELAIDAYTTAIDRDPHAVIAAVNLANLHARRNRLEAAQNVYNRVLLFNDTNLSALVAYHDFALRITRPELGAAAFVRAHHRVPADKDIQAWTAYALAQTDRWKEAIPLVRTNEKRQPAVSFTRLAQVLVALYEDDPDGATADVTALLASERVSIPGVLQRLIADLERFAASYPDNPWPYYLTAKVLVAQDRPDLAKLALTEFTRLCAAPDCQSRLSACLSTLNDK